MQSHVLVLLLALIQLVRAALEPFSSGASTLFIGHSFFVPTSREFDSLIDASSFPNHSFQDFFRGGENGAPENLWKDNRCGIEPLLATGNVELMGMTAHQGTTTEDYARWIDLALTYNRETSFFIGIAWVTEGANIEDAPYAATTAEHSQQALEGVTELRQKYPSTPIFLIHYGHSAVKMRELFAANNLPGIDNMLGPASNSIYRDRSPGHEGEMMRSINALVWYSILYDGDPDPSLVPSHDAPSVSAVVSYTLDKNSAMNDQVLVGDPSDYVLDPTGTGCGDSNSGTGGSLIQWLVRNIESLIDKIIRFLTN